MTLLSVVIVNYQSGELLNACLEALFRDVDLKDIEVFVVNNDCAADLSSVRDSAQTWGADHSEWRKRRFRRCSQYRIQSSRRENFCSC